MTKILKLAGVVDRWGGGGGQFWQRRCVGERLGLSSIDVTDVEVREGSSFGTWIRLQRGSWGVCSGVLLGVRSLPVRIRPPAVGRFRNVFGFFEAIIDAYALRYCAICWPPVTVRLYRRLSTVQSADRLFSRSDLPPCGNYIRWLSRILGIRWPFVWIRP